MKSKTYYQKIAEEWRQEQQGHRATSGIALIWEEKVYGWKDKLRDAAHERPNSIAVDPDSNVFIASGGDDDQGARVWVVVV